MRSALTILLLFMLSLNQAMAKERIVNVFAWTSEIPEYIVRLFEEETGINVNFSTYENNESMYAKLRASQKSVYDVVMPSSYFVDRMHKQNMLEKLDKSKLPNWKNLNSTFLNPVYDPKSEYSVPYIWGITGIFYNAKYYKTGSIKKWSDLWDKRFDNQLMLLDDMREVFTMALLSLGYSANETNPAHIKEAFERLILLSPNIKVFSTETVVSILIDEDATAGMSWNGDNYRAFFENSDIQFVFPKEGFVIWVDTFAIPKNAPHPNEAYEFINFMMRPDIAKEIALYTRFPIANEAGQKLLPKEIRDNPVIYPSKKVMKQGQFQIDLGEETLSIYEKYWEELKMRG